MEEYQVKMNLRKSRAKKFLENETTLFTLLFCLTLYGVLQQAVRICFKLFNSDKVSLGLPDVADVRRAEKRRRGKQEEGPPEPGSEQERSRYTLGDLKKVSMSIINYLWMCMLGPIEAGRFWIAAAFWPASQNVSSMYKTMSADFLRAMSGLKWRILGNLTSSPYVLLQMASENCSSETREAFTEKFLDEKPCCLDPYWGRPVHSEVETAFQTGGIGSAAQILMQHVAKFSAEARAVSVREEQLHAVQRKFAGGFNAKARPFVVQSAQTVLATASKHHAARKVRRLDQNVKQWRQLKQAVRRGKVVHPRAKQYGSAFFTFASVKVRQGSTKTRAELRAEWASLPDREKDDWTLRHKAKVALQRRAKEQAIIVQTYIEP